MKMRDRRAQARIAVSLRAELNSGDAWVLCRILDVSENGFLLVCNTAFGLGRRLDLRCELYQGKLFQCKVEIRHAEEMGMGVKIVEIDSRSIDLFQLFLQERYSAILNQSKPK
jgi:PilZ domain-containing protein